MDAGQTLGQAGRTAAILFRVKTLLRQYWWVLILTTVIGLAIAAFISSRQETWYRSSARMMVSGRIRVTEGNAYSEEGSNFIGTQTELMKSSQVTTQAEARVKSQGRVPAAPISSLEVGVVPNTSIFQLRLTAKTPEYCAAFLEAVIEEYTALKRSMRNEKSETAISGITDELLRFEKEWKAGEEEVVKFQSEHSLVFLKEGENTAAKYLAELNQRLAELSTRLKLLQNIDENNLRLFREGDSSKAAEGNEAKAGSSPELTSEQDFTTNYIQVKQNIQLLEQKRIQLLTKLREGHPDLIALETQIADQKKLLLIYQDQNRENLEALRRSLAAQIKTVEGEVEIWNVKALEIGRLIAEYNKHQNKVERAKSMYDRLLANVGNVGLTKNLDQDVISVLEHPTIPVAVLPGFARNLATGSVAGLIIGMLILFLVDRSKAEIASPDEFLANFTHHRMLGVVPAEPNATAKLAISDERHSFAESFYNIRSSLFFMPYDGPMPKTLLITSAVPNEGKSTLSANIALSFAYAGSRTLLIDGDLRRGAVHRVFDCPNDQGFSDVLQHKLAWREVVVQTQTPNLFVIPRGSAIAQPSKYLVHSSMDELLRELHEEYDQIIIDSCPVLVADDTTSLAPKVEAVIVVARISVVTVRQLANTLSALTSRQANVLGVILNGIDVNSSSYNYYNYTSYYTDDKPVEQSI